MICSDNTTKKLLDGLWATLRHVQAVIDLLEDIGLAVDGCTAPGKPSVSSLYAAMTAADQAIQDAFGIPRDTPYHDEANMVIANARKDERESSHFPPRLERALADIADTASKKHIISRKPAPDAVPFEVTVAMSGGITVMARCQEEAMAAANAMDTGSLLEKAAWDSASATDAYRQP